MVLIVVFAEFSYVQQHFNPKHVPESAGSCPKQPAKRLFYKNKSPLKCKRSKINKQRPWILPLEEIQIKSPSELVISPQAHWSVTRHPHIIFFFLKGEFLHKNGHRLFCVSWSRSESRPCSAREFRRRPTFPRQGEDFYWTESTEVQGNLSGLSSHSALPFWTSGRKHFVSKEPWKVS